MNFDLRYKIEVHTCTNISFGYGYSETMKFFLISNTSKNTIFLEQPLTYHVMLHCFYINDEQKYLMFKSYDKELSY